jgi:hypothetical protein
MARFKAAMSMAAWLLAGLHCPGIVHAADQIMTLEDRKAVMDAQIELLRKEMELNTVLRQVNGAGTLSLPMIVSISTVGSERSARLQFPNGMVGRYREGEMIRSDLVLSAITPMQVMVSVRVGKKATAVALDFLAGAAPRPASGSAAGAASANAFAMPASLQSMELQQLMVPALPTMSPMSPLPMPQTMQELPMPAPGSILPAISASAPTPVTSPRPQAGTGRDVVPKR